MELSNKRTAKEYQLPKIRDISIKSKYGTLDKSNPEILYIRSKTIITPIIEKKDFSEDIIEIKKSFEKIVKQTVNESEDFEDKYIWTIELSEKGITFGKKSRLKYDIFLKPKALKDLKEYDDEITRMSHVLNRNLTDLLDKYNIKAELN